MKTEVYHFWVGKFNSEDEYSNFLDENESYYNDDLDNNKKYVSKFAESQDKNWIDYDFVESGFEDNEKSLKDKFKNYSYSDKWISEIQNRIDKQKTIEINTILFVSKSQIENPTSINHSSFYLNYIGEIEFKI